MDALPVCLDVIMENILPFVGDYQFRFVAGVDRTFYMAYTQKYPSKRTSTKCSSIHSLRRAIIYLNEVRDLSQRQESIVAKMVVDLTIRYGCMELFRFAQKRHPKIHMDESGIMKVAANAGKLDSMRRLREDGCHWDERTTFCAASNGNLEILQYAHTNGCAWNEEVCYNAASRGHLQALQYAHSNGCLWNKGTTLCAAQNGHLHILQYAHTNGCPWDVSTCSRAASCGHLHILQYAHTNGCPWDVCTCSCAAGEGYLEILQYAHVNGCPWDVNTCSRAAVNGHIQALQYAHSHGCPWDSQTCFCAAYKGYLHVLQYARTNGCPWNLRDVIRLSRTYQHRDVELWVSQFIMDEDDMSSDTDGRIRWGDRS